MSKETTEKKMDIRYFLVRKSVLYKKTAHRPGSIIVAENLEDDDKFQDLLGYSTKKLMDENAHLLELTAEQVKDSEPSKSDFWFEPHIKREIINAAYSLAKKEEK